MNSEIGTMYRNIQYNYLLNLNFKLNFEGTENTLESRNNILKLKTGFIKQYSFNRDLEVIVGGRLNFSLNRTEFEYNNLKMKCGFIHKNFSTFADFTTSKNLSLDKINANFHLNNFIWEHVKLFGQADYRKNRELNEPKFNVAIGNQIELNEETILKVKFSNMKSFDVSLTNKIRDNLKVTVNWNALLRENDSREVDKSLKCKSGILIQFI